MGFDEELDAGLDCLENGYIEKAREHFEICTKLQPGDYNAWLYLGICYNELERYNDALAAFKKCIEIDEKLPYAWSNMGLVYLRRHEINEAARHLFKAAKIDPEDLNTRFNLGLAFSKLPEKDVEALAEFRYVLEHDESIAEAWHYMGKIFVDIKKPAHALFCLEKARSLGLEGNELAVNNKLIVDLKFDGVAPVNPFSPDVIDNAFRIR